MTEKSELLKGVIDRLDTVRQTARRLYFLDGFASILVFLLLFSAVTFFLDTQLMLPKAVRLIFLFAGIALLVWLVIIKRFIYPLKVAISDDDLVVMVEEKNPELNDSLISALQLSRQDPTKYGDFNSPELVNVVIEDAVKTSSNLNFSGIVVPRNVTKKLGKALFYCLIGLVFCIFISPNYASIYFGNRIWGGDGKYPQKTYLCEPIFPDKIARGDDVTITIKIDEKKSLVISESAKLYYKFVSGERDKVKMNLIGKATTTGTSEFSCVVTRVLEDFEFHIESGDDTTKDYTVKVLIPPTVESIVHYYEYPIYTKLKPEGPEEGGNVRALIGTTVRLEGKSNEELVSAKIIIGGKRTKEDTKPIVIEKDTTGANKIIKVQFDIIIPLSEYTIILAAKNGLSNEKRDPPRYTIKGIIDIAPGIKVLDPTTDEWATPVATRPLSLETNDDYGISKISFNYKIIGAQAKEYTNTFGAAENSPPEYGARTIKSYYEFDISKLGVKLGDVIEYYFTAEDYKDIGERNVTKTPTRRFSIVSKSEIEKRLIAEIETIKNEIRIQKKNQERLHDNVTKFTQKFGNIENLNQDQKTELRSIELDQNSITQRLDSIQKRLVTICKQGVYNKVFDEKSAKTLQDVIGIMNGVIGEPGSSQPGKSPSASLSVNTASKAKDKDNRVKALRNAADIQDIIIGDLAAVLALLDKWSTYQEIVRAARELAEEQKRINEMMKYKPCPNCKEKIPPGSKVCPNCDKSTNW